MRVFAIKDLERFSGIKAHTIRTWEKRYGIFEPMRSSGNIRAYSMQDVCVLLCISLLTDYGYKISKLAGLSYEDLQLRVSALKSDEARQRQYIYRLLCGMFANDIEEFEDVLDEALLSRGIDNTLKDIVMPFMEKVPLLSYKETGIEVHFVVTAIRKKLILGIERAKPVASNAKTALLFLPKGEHYDLMLLYLNYMLKNCGIKVLYLGTNISMENLELMAQRKKPDYLCTYIHTKRGFNADDYAALAKKHFPGINLFVAYADEQAVSRGTGHDNLRFFKYYGASKVFDDVV